MANVVVPPIGFHAYYNGMDPRYEVVGPVIALAFSLRRFAPWYETSLLPPCADRFAYRSELVVCFRSSARWPILGPVALDHSKELESPSPPINTD